MKTYKYTAVNIDNREVKGTFIAEDEQDLARKLLKQKLFLIACAPYSGKTPSAFFTTGTGKISLDEISRFCGQFAIMLGTGIPLLECLEALRDQRFSSYFRKIVALICEDVRAGALLSEAASKHGKAFPEFFISMISVGEASGKLDTVFASLAEYFEKAAAIRRKRKSALAYPLMLLIMTVGIVVLMLTFVVPRFRDVLTKLDIEAEGLIKAVYDVSDFLIGNWIYLLAAVVLVVTLFTAFGFTKNGRYLYDKLRLHLPFFGKVAVNQASASFARAFGLLLSCGMDMSEALDAVQAVIVNRDIKKRFSKAAEEVRQGAPLSDSLSKYRVFPNVLLQMITTGEKTASLDGVLLRSCTFFETLAENALLSAVSKIQPVMLILMAAIVAVLFLAVYSPMISIMNGLS